MLAGTWRSGDGPYLAVAAIPWILGCLFGGPADLLGFYLVYPFCCGALLECRSHWPVGGLRRLEDLIQPGPLTSLASLGVAAAVACVPFALLGEPRGALRIFAALAADGMWLCAAVMWDRSRRPAHHVFVPVPFGRRLHRAAGLGRARRPPELRALVASARGLVATRTAQVLGLRGGGVPVGLPPGPRPESGGLAVPAPERAGSARVSWESIGRLWVVAASDEHPSLADFVAHEAYQASLPWGGRTGPRARDERLEVASFRASSSAAGVERTLATVMRFSDRWLKDTLRGAAPASVGRLLASQRRASRVLPARGDLRALRSGTDRDGRGLLGGRGAPPAPGQPLSGALAVPGRKAA